LVIRGTTWPPRVRDADRALVGHPQHGPVGPFAREREHDRAERGEQDRERGHRADVERVVHGERPVHHVDRTRPAQRGIQDVQVVAGEPGRALVGQPEHVPHDPVVRGPDAQRQPPAGGRLRGQRLPRQRDRMLRLQRHHGGP
jgi:hypothetical protein